MCNGCAAPDRRRLHSRRFVNSRNVLPTEVECRVRSDGVRYISVTLDELLGVGLPNLLEEHAPICPMKRRFPRRSLLNIRTGASDGRFLKNLEDSATPLGLEFAERDLIEGHMRRIQFGIVLCVMFARPGFTSPILISQTDPGSAPLQFAASSTPVPEPACIAYGWTALALTVLFRRRALRVAGTDR